jgi:hypothetical protein
MDFEYLDPDKFDEDDEDDEDDDDRRYLMFDNEYGEDDETIDFSKYEPYEWEIRDVRRPSKPPNYEPHEWEKANSKTGECSCGKNCHCSSPSQFASKLRQIALSIEPDGKSASEIARDILAAIGEMEMSQPVQAHPVRWGGPGSKIFPTNDSFEDDSEPDWD